MVYCIMRVRNMGFNLSIMVLFPDVTSEKMTFTCRKTGKAVITNNFISSINYFLGIMIPPISRF